MSVNTQSENTQAGNDQVSIPLALMNLKFRVYTYITAEHEPGTLMVHPNLCRPFDKQELFEMDNVKVEEISLLDILRKGFIKIGDTDIMENIDIEYPLIPNDVYPNNRITGKHMDYELDEIARKIDPNIDFVIDQHKDYEIAECLDSHSNSSSNSGSDSGSDLVSGLAKDTNLETRCEQNGERPGQISQTVELGEAVSQKIDMIFAGIDNCQDDIAKINEILSEF